MNYTKPNDENHEDSPQDWLAAALVFTQALGLIIPKGEGLLLKAKGDAADYFGPKEGFLVIANLDEQIQVFPLSDYIEDQSEFTDGMWITVSVDDAEENNEESDEQ